MSNIMLHFVTRLLLALLLPIIPLLGIMLIDRVFGKGKAHSSKHEDVRFNSLWSFMYDNSLGSLGK